MNVSIHSKRIEHDQTLTIHQLLSVLWIWPSVIFDRSILYPRAGLAIYLIQGSVEVNGSVDMNGPLKWTDRSGTKWGSYKELTS